jgi:hypothetical protein
MGTHGSDIGSERFISMYQILPLITLNSATKGARTSDKSSTADVKAGVKRSTWFRMAAGD